MESCNEEVRKDIEDIEDIVGTKTLEIHDFSRRIFDFLSDLEVNSLPEPFSSFRDHWMTQIRITKEVKKGFFPTPGIEPGWPERFCLG